MSSVSTDAYAEAALESRNGFLPALKELQRLEACLLHLPDSTPAEGRPALICIIAGVRKDVYARPAPLTRDLLAHCVHKVDCQNTLPCLEDSGPERVCRACLGVLQSLDGPVHPVSSELLSEMPDTDGAGAFWQWLAHGHVDSVAEHVRSLNYEVDCSAAVEISVPAAAQLRQLALWYHLQATESTAHLFPGQTLRDDVVDLKECLRLKGVVSEHLAERLGRPLDMQHGALRITLNYIHPPSAKESNFVFNRPSHGRSQRRKRRREVIDIGRSASDNVAITAEKWALDKFRAECAVPPMPVLQSIHLLVACRSLPLYVGGYYRKLQRDVSQSPWTIEGIRKGRTSVQEEIQKVVLPALRCDAAKFITAGREDMDVRMLGDGRPFVLEILNQRAAVPAQDAFDRMVDRLAQSGVGVEVRRLQSVGKEKLQLIKDGEQHKQKSYEAICELPCEVTPEIVERINSSKDLVLAQTTPTRVAHRRALLVRERTVHSMRCTPVPEDSHKLVLNLRTQAGTYIKEFVHGDEGRTVPNLGTLLGCAEPAKILQLDVLNVHMDFL